MWIALICLIGSLLVYTPKSCILALEHGRNHDRAIIQSHSSHNANSNIVNEEGPERLISTSMHSGRPMDHSGPAVDCHCPEDGVGDEHNLQDRKDKACLGSRNWIGRSGVGLVEEVEECILGEGIDRVEEAGGSFAAR